MDSSSSGRKKRPRSATPTSMASGGSPKKKSKTTKKSKNKTNKNRSSRTVSEATTSSSSLSQQPKPSLGPVTATADGQMMTQMLSTFSKLEQSRFEAFKRATFNADAVQEWVAACLLDRHYGVAATDAGTAAKGSATTSTSGGGASGGGGGPQRQQRQVRPLSDLVLPGQADDIGMVVATLAKVYAQRLVSTARTLASSSSSSSSSANNNTNDSGNNNNNSNGGGGSSEQQDSASAATAGTEQAALRPEQILEAFRLRQRQGQDPGFFLQSHPVYEQWLSMSTSTKTAAGPASSNNDNKPRTASFDERRLAALAAQEAYDRTFPDRVPPTKHDDDGDDDNNNDDTTAEEQKQQQQQDPNPPAAKEDTSKDGNAAGAETTTT